MLATRTRFFQKLIKKLTNQLVSVSAVYCLLSVVCLLSVASCLLSSPLSPPPSPKGALQTPGAEQKRVGYDLNDSGATRNLTRKQKATNTALLVLYYHY
jgi:hypothetical protein